jgi:hypothetical protein
MVQIWWLKYGPLGNFGNLFHNFNTATHAYGGLKNIILEEKKLTGCLSHLP